MSKECYYNNEKVRLFFREGSFKYYVSIRGGGRGSVNCLHWLTGGRGGVRNGPKMAYVILEWPLRLENVTITIVHFYFKHYHPKRDMLKTVLSI